MFIACNIRRIAARELKNGVLTMISKEESCAVFTHCYLLLLKAYTVEVIKTSPNLQAE